VNAYPDTTAADPYLPIIPVSPCSRLIATIAVAAAGVVVTDPRHLSAIHPEAQPTR